MPGTYQAQGLVLRRTKLGETDLIVTLLCDGAAQVRAVAKGARKPASRLAGVVNLGNEGAFMLHRGRNLDTITEGRLVASRAELAFEIERSAMAEAVLDVAAELTAEGEHDPRLLPLTSTALDALLAAPLDRLPLVAAAYVFKASAMQGYRPSAETCVRCGGRVDLAQTAGGGVRPVFSLAEGGVVCPECSTVDAGHAVDAALLAWVNSLLGMRFAELLAMDVLPGERALGLDMLAFAQRWVAHYPGVRPRALDFVLGSGIY